MERPFTQSQIIEDYISQQEERQEQETKQKQAYLKHEVFEYYQEHQEILETFVQFFINFVYRKKQIRLEEPKLECVSFEDLQEMVSRFKEKNHEKVPAGFSDVFPASDVDTSKVEIDPPEFRAQKVHYENGGWDHQLSGYEECHLSKQYFKADAHKTAVIVFSKNEIRKSGGFFGLGAKSELWVDVKSNLVEYTPSRKIQDFRFLRQALSKQCPFTFIPPLSMNDKDLNRIEEEPIRSNLMQECRTFINAVCKNETLLQTYWTFRFFKEPKYENFTAMRSKLENLSVQGLKHVQTGSGVVEIQLSQRNELEKEDYTRKSQMLSRTWQAMQGHNERIVNHLKEAKKEMDRQRGLLDIMSADFKAAGVHHPIYNGLANVLLTFNDIYRSFTKSLDRYHHFLDTVSLQIGQEAPTSWQAFSSYAQQIQVISNEYKNRRRVFLEKEEERREAMVRIEKKFQVIGEGQTTAAQSSIKPTSVIDGLGIEHHSRKQVIWLEKFSKWQGYMNKQFSSSFCHQVQGDVDKLEKIITDYSVSILEASRQDEDGLIQRIKNLRLGQVNE